MRPNKAQEQELSRAQKQKLADDAKLLRAWKRWHRKQLEAALVGPHGAMMADLMTLLDLLELSSGATLLGFLRGVDWDAFNYGVRLIALHEVHRAIIKLRERYDMPPFDDRIDRDNNVFRLARAIILPAHVSN